MWKLAPFFILTIFSVLFSPLLYANQCTEMFKFDEVQFANEQAVLLFKDAVVYDSQKKKPADFEEQVTAKYSAALVPINFVLAVEPQNQKFLLMKAKSLTQTRKYFEALDVLQVLLALNPHFRPALLEMEDIYHRLGKTEEQKLTRLLLNFIEKLDEGFNPYIPR